ncbi:MAG: hypothetical protein EBZ69_01440 [Alphaproteobacteria bacterium]|nr:hypothetical protein [Alphaproteobacteria bacterium]
MDIPGLARAVLAGGIWAGVSTVLLMAVGEPPNAVLAATEGAVMAGSALAADYAHHLAEMNPTGITSAVATGAVFTVGMKLVRDSDDYVQNFIAGAGTDLATEYVASMY